MADLAMGNRVNEFEFLEKSRSTREAFACWARCEFGNAKDMARRQGLTVHEARTVLNATASASTLDRLWRPFLAGLAVQLAQEFITREKDRQAHASAAHAYQSTRMAEVGRGLVSVLRSGPGGVDLGSDGLPGKGAGVAGEPRAFGAGEPELRGKRTSLKR